MRSPPCRRDLHSGFGRGAPHHHICAGLKRCASSQEHGHKRCYQLLTLFKPERIDPGQYLTFMANPDCAVDSHVLDAYQRAHVLPLAAGAGEEDAAAAREAGAAGGGGGGGDDVPADDLPS